MPSPATADPSLSNGRLGGAGTAQPGGFGHQVTPRGCVSPSWPHLLPRPRGASVPPNHAALTPPDPLCAPPVPGDAGMPVPACLQRPALSPVPEPGRAMEEPANGGAELWGEGLRNSNNNAAPGGWPGARGGHALAPFGGPGAEPSYLGRVVLEIVESERTYARDLRSIVEVSAGGMRGHPSGGLLGGALRPPVPMWVPGRVTWARSLTRRSRCCGRSRSARSLATSRTSTSSAGGCCRCHRGAQLVPHHPGVAGGCPHPTPSVSLPPAPCCKTWRAAPATPWPWLSASSPG